MNPRQENPRQELSCVSARERLSARMDGELRELGGDEAVEAMLRAHLAGCAACRAHERALAQLARGFDVLREPVSVPDLWPRIERRLHRRRAAPALARVAAALIGFAGLGGAALYLERAHDAPPAERHLFDLLGPRAATDTLFASLPEYRILRALPPEVNSR